MAAISTRQTAGTGATVIGAPLSNTQVDNNFININTDLVSVISNTFTIVQATDTSLISAIALG